MTSFHKVTSLPTTLAANDLIAVKDDSGARLYSVTKEGDKALRVVSIPHVTGPVSLYHGEKGTYTILNYTDREVYEIASADGVISRNGETLSFVVSDTSKLSASFTVGGVVFTVAMNAQAVNKPTIISPTANATNVPLVTALAAATPFGVNFSGSTDVHVASDWEVSTDPNFTTLVASSYNDKTSLTSWPIP